MEEIKVKGYVRKTKDGKLVRVKGYVRKVKKKVKKALKEVEGKIVQEKLEREWLSLIKKLEKKMEKMNKLVQFGSIYSLKKAIRRDIEMLEKKYGRKIADNFEKELLEKLRKHIKKKQGGLK